MTKVEIEIDNVAPARLSKAELDAEMMLLWTAAIRLGERHRALQAEWDKRQVGGFLKELIAPKFKRRPRDIIPSIKAGRSRCQE